MYPLYVLEIEIGIIKLPRMSNFSDLDPFFGESSIQVKWIDLGQDIGSPDLSGYARTSDIPDVSNLATKDSLGGYAKTSDLLNYARDTDLTNLETDVTNLAGAGQALSGRLGIVESTQAKQKTDIGKAMTEALKVRTTSAQPVQNQATPIGIQAAQSPSAQAGMISAGLAGLSRSNKKFKNKTLNI